MTLKEHLAIYKRGLKRMWEGSQTYVLCIVFENLITALLPYIPVYFSAKLIDALAERAPVSTLAQYVCLTVGIVFLMSLLNRYIQSLYSKATPEIYLYEDWSFSQKAMEMSYASIEDREVSLLKERIRVETQTGYNRFYLYGSVERFVERGTKIIASVTMTFSFFLIDAIAWYFKFALLALMALSIVCTVITTAKVQTLENRYWDDCVDMNVLSSKFSGYMDDYSAGKDIRLYHMSDNLAERMAALDGKFYAMSIQKANKQTLLSLPSTFLNEFLKFVTYLLLIFAAMQGAVSVGSITKYVVCIMMLLDAVSGMVKGIKMILTNNVYMKRYFSYLDIPNNMYKGSLTVEKRDDREYYVEFRDVSFKYPNSDAYALRHVNVKFRIGEKLAVVGMNGSGKTTFIKLMCRLYDPTEGEILLNGVNIQKYDYDEYMSIFSVVFQDFRLFSFSLGQNVAASDKYDRARVEECLREAGFGERLAALPDGVDTCLYKDYSEDGIEISGGEAQKIALARALYKNAPFIILDEPTAALDPVAEYEVYSRFNEIVGDRTAIYISHRLASCRFCDNIVVFDHGGIVQHGSHDELMAEEDGKYRELWIAQAQYYDEKKG